MTRLFITGTDTEVGKTFIACTIMDYVKQRGTTSIGFKPVASGCEETDAGLVNSDALALQKASSFELEYAEVNPFSFKEPIAPHLAAKKEQQTISLSALTNSYLNLTEKKSDLLLVEGAGGWRLPLGDQVFMSDFVKQHKLPVLLVVGMRLGCLNHARLTAEAILNDGLKLAGWVANHVNTEMAYCSENIDALKDLIPAPFIGELPMVNHPGEAWTYLDFTPLFSG